MYRTCHIDYADISNISPYRLLLRAKGLSRKDCDRVVKDGHSYLFLSDRVIEKWCRIDRMYHEGVICSLPLYLNPSDYFEERERLRNRTVKVVETKDIMFTDWEFIDIGALGAVP